MGKLRPVEDGPQSEPEKKTLVRSDILGQGDER